MKKTKEKSVSTISINKYKNENVDWITRISPRDIDRYMNTLTPDEERKLAFDLAHALGEPNNVEYFLRYTGTIPKTYLLERLAYVLSRTDIDNKAAYFNSILKSYGTPRKRYPRY